MSDFEVQLEGTEELLENLSKISSDIRTNVAVKAVNAGGIQIENKAKMNSPVLTGALRNSITTHAHLGADGKAVAEVGPQRGLVYARIQEFGGTISAKNHKYLVYKTKAGWRKSKSVKIVGKHYLEKAIESEKGRAVDAMSAVVRTYLEKQ